MQAPLAPCIIHESHKVEAEGPREDEGRNQTGCMNSGYGAALKAKDMLARATGMILEIVC